MIIKMNILCVLAGLLASIAAIQLAVSTYKPEWNGIRWASAKIAKDDAEKTERNIKIATTIMGAAGAFLIAGCIGAKKMCPTKV